MTDTRLHDELTAIARRLIDSGITREQAMTEFDKTIIASALNKAKGNSTLAAQMIGVHRNTVISQRTKLLGPSREQLRRRQRSRRRRR